MAKREVRACVWEFSEDATDGVPKFDRSEEIAAEIEQMKRRGYRPLDPDTAATHYLGDGPLVVFEDDVVAAVFVRQFGGSPAY